MFSFDFKALSSIENHRGVAYTLFVCALFCPSFIAVFFLAPKLVVAQLLVSALLASCVGLLATAICTLGCFNALADPARPGEPMAAAGANSLGLGSAMSMALQTTALFLAVGGKPQLYGYVKLVVMLAFIVAAVMQVVAWGARYHYKRRNASLATAPDQGAA